MKKEELERVLRELHMLWERNKLVEDTTDDIDFILNQVISKIGKGE